MTIFDIKPYSFWRNLYRTAFRAWVNLGQDTPRTVLRLYLLEYIVRYQQDIINRLNGDYRELAVTATAVARLNLQLTAQEAPEALLTDVRRPNAPADGVTPQTAAILSATEEPATRVCFECGQEIDLAEDHTDDDGHYYHEWCCPVCIQRDRELYHAATA